MKHQAIYNLYPSVKRIEEDENGVLTILDINNKEVVIDENAVETERASLQTEADNTVQAKIDLKASAKAKLIAGEALTEAEADTIVL
tara:strand:- start:24 stop:284 length:261 start_codon:yes stop_codon:yes gene_type:complete